MEIRITGLDKLAEDLKNMEISSAREKKALRTVGDILKKAFDENIAIRTGRSKSRIKRTIKRAEGYECHVYIDTWYYKFTEFGTSQQKKNVGLIANAIESVADECISTATEIMLGGRI